MPHVTGEHERPLAREPLVGRIDEAERAKDLLQRVQLAVNVADHSHPFCTVREKLRDVAMRGERPLNRQVLHHHVFHLQNVELIRRQAEDEATASEIFARADIRLPG